MPLETPVIQILVENPQVVIDEQQQKDKWDTKVFKYSIQENIEGKFWKK